MLTVSRTALVVLAAAMPGLAFASSDAAWEKFAKDVEQKCTDAAAETFRKPKVAVDPQGTESYGVAIVYGKLKAGKQAAAVICVMDKKTGKIELGSELGNDVVRVRKPKADDNKADDNKDGDDNE